MLFSLSGGECYGTSFFKIEISHLKLSSGEMINCRFMSTVLNVNVGETSVIDLFIVTLLLYVL